MPFSNVDPYYQQDILNEVLRGTTENLPTLRLLLSRDGAAYESGMRQAFEFIRRNGDRRYSSRTLQSILQSADDAESIRVSGAGIGGSLPALISLEYPTSYDEETEVKSGGRVAVGVLSDREDGRYILAVAKSQRKNRLGTALIRLAESLSAPVSVYVDRRNNDGQRFLLAAGFMPVSISAVGTVCYSSMDSQAEIDDGGTDRLRRLRRREPNFNPRVSVSYADDGGYDEMVPDEEPPSLDPLDIAVPQHEWRRINRNLSYAVESYVDRVVRVRNNRLDGANGFLSVPPRLWSADIAEFEAWLITQVEEILGWTFPTNPEQSLETPQELYDEISEVRTTTQANRYVDELPARDDGPRPSDERTIGQDWNFEEYREGLREALDQLPQSATLQTEEVEPESEAPGADHSLALRLATTALTRQQKTDLYAQLTNQYPTRPTPRPQAIDESSVETSGTSHNPEAGQEAS